MCVHNDDLDAVQVVHDRAVLPGQRAVPAAAEMPSDPDTEAAAARPGDTPSVEEPL
jgi:hypothetical protein